MDIEINEKEKIKAKIKELEDRLGEIGEEGVEEMSSKGREYAQMMREKGQEAYKKARSAGKQMDQYAHEHPWVWMGIGILVGMTIGAAASMKTCKKYCR